jgi:hypothetical protein
MTALLGESIIEMREGKVLSVNWHLVWELGSVPGIGEVRAARLRSEGINTVHRLAGTSAQSIAMAIRGGRSEILCLR